MSAPYELGPKGIRVHPISPGPLKTRAASGGLAQALVYPRGDHDRGEDCTREFQQNLAGIADVVIRLERRQLEAQD